MRPGGGLLLERLKHALACTALAVVLGAALTLVACLIVGSRHRKRSR